MSELTNKLATQVEAARVRLQNLPKEGLLPTGFDLDYCCLPPSDEPVQSGPVWNGKASPVPKSGASSVNYG